MEDGLGWKFWLWVIGVCLAVGLGGLLLFLLVGAAWYRWGFLGGMIFFGALLLLAAWIHDKRAAKRYDDPKIYG
jgi:4-hydroxybenzoate polyprenyltransferase